MKERNVSLDALRVLIMFMIVAGHALVHGHILDTVERYSFEYYAGNVLMAFLTVHVNCFVLISGYFLSEKEFSVHKWFKLWGQTLFWSVFLFFAVFILRGFPEIDLKELVKSFLPFTQQRYWFMTTYLCMYILIPFLNAGSKHLKKKEYQKFLAGFFAVYIVLQNLVYIKNFTTVNAYSPLFFCFLYLAGAYIKKFSLPKKFPWFLAYVATSCITALSRFVASWVTMLLFKQEMLTSFLYSYTSITCVLGSVFLFMTFLSLDIKRNGIIGKAAISIAPLTLGVYLIHDHPNVRKYIWEKLHPFTSAHSGVGMIIIVLADAALIFCVACVMEKSRIFVAHKIAQLISRSKSTT